MESKEGFSPLLSPNAHKTNIQKARKKLRRNAEEAEDNDFIKKLNKHFTSFVEVPRMKVGDKQEIESLINEEAFLFAKYLRGERPTWIPRIVEL